MKIFILSIFTFLFCNVIYGQNLKSFFSNKKTGYITKRDGTTEHGTLKFGTYYDIKFFGEHGQKTSYNAKDLKEVVIYGDSSSGKIDTLHYKPLVVQDRLGGTSVFLLEETYRGENINMYKQNVLQGGGMDANGNFRPTIQNTFYYINFPDKLDIGYSVSRNKVFKKELPKLLKACPEVVNKLKSKIYRRKDLEQIVREYDECVNSQ